MLDGYRAALRRGQAPILVVPTLANVDRYRTELAAGGVVFAAHAARVEGRKTLAFARSTKSSVAARELERLGQRLAA